MRESSGGLAPSLMPETSSLPTVLGPDDIEPLYMEMSGQVTAFFRYLTNETDIAPDLAQETFLKAWQALQSYNAPDGNRPVTAGNMTGWLLRIARNTGIDYLRHRRLKSFTPMSAITDNEYTTDGLANPNLLYDEGPSPEEIILTADEEALVRQALDSIPQTYAEPLRMLYFEGREQADVMSAIGAPSVDAYKMKVSRGYKALGPVLSEALGIPLPRTRAGANYDSAKRKRSK